jgi:hypothetical protein
MSEPVASEPPPQEKRSLLTILVEVITSRDFALRLMIGAVGAAALSWLGPKGAFAGLLLSQLLGDTIKEFVTSRNVSVRRLWFVTALTLLFDRMRHRIAPGGATPVAAPLVSTLAATVVVVAAFTAVDTARGQSLLDHRPTTFFGGTHHATAPSVRLHDGRVVTSSARLTFRDVRVGGSSEPESFVLSSGSYKLRQLRIDASPPAFHAKNGCPHRLPARSSCSVGIVFQPDRPGHVEGRLTISFVEDPELTLVLEGTAVKVEVVGAILNPSSLRFGRTRVGSTAPAKTITLHAGNTPLPIAEITTGAKEFAVSANDCPDRLSAGSACRIRVAFAPASAGTRSATLTVARRGGGRPVTAALTGAGLSPPTQAKLTPARADFGSVQVGSRSTPVAFTLAAGSTALAIASVTASADFRIGATSCSGRLAPASTCTIQVTFAPRATGGDNGTLTVARAGGAAPFTAGLRGVGLPLAEPKLVPTHADFGTVQVATRSHPTQFTLTAGSTAMTDIKIASNPADYMVDRTKCGNKLAAHDTCTISVVFAPIAGGVRGGTLTVTRADGGTPLTAPLTGTGLAVAPKLTPDHADFGDVDIGARSAPTNFTLAAGSSALPIAGISATVKDYRVSANNCPAQLDAGHSCTIDVTFVPVAQGKRLGTLVVRSDGGRQLSAALTGVGVSVAPTLVPAKFDFGSVRVGASSTTVAFTLSAGSSPFPYRGITTRSKDFRITAKTCSGTLNPSTSCTISVVFAPIAGGVRGGTLTVTRADGGTPLTAPLTGTGLAPYVVLSPTSIDFGNVCTDCGTLSPVKKVRLSNTGNATLTIRSITSSDPRHFTVANGSCGKTLAPGGVCTFSVKFIASSGSWHATITLDADGGGQHSLGVSGAGVVG